MCNENSPDLTLSLTGVDCAGRDIYAIRDSGNFIVGHLRLKPGTELTTPDVWLHWLPADVLHEDDAEEMRAIEAEEAGV